MKYLILILLILLVIFATKLLRSKDNQSSQQPGPRPRTPRAGSAEDDGGEEQIMLACAQCGLHLPSNEALPGKGGVFCSEAHRALFEDQEGND